MVKEMTQEVYVGELIRREIKSRFLTNTYVLQQLKSKGIKLTDTRFSSKIYGVREKFNRLEISAINDILETSFEIAEEIKT